MTTESLIAVIDDDDSFRIALVDSLCSLGYAARGFVSAEDYIAGEGGGSWSCIITDVHMSGMSGPDLARLLTARGSKIPVVMITAHCDPGLDAKVATSGAACFLRKPFDADALVDCLEQALKA